MIQKVLKILSCNENALGSPISSLPFNRFRSANTNTIVYLRENKLNDINLKEKLFFHKVNRSNTSF